MFSWNMRPIILHANTYRFAPGEEIVAGPVASRMQLWCLEGRGEALVDGEVCDLAPGRVLLLPWGFRVRYRADRRRPCRLAGIHLVPVAADLDPMPFSRVPHDGAVVPGLADADDPVCRGRHRLEWAQHEAWRALSDYALATFVRERPRVEEQRRLGVQLVAEWRRVLGRDRGHGDPGLAAIRGYLQAHPGQPLGLDQLAAIAACSPATLSRRIRAAHGCSPTLWVQRLRVELAKDRLADRDRSRAAIATELGFCDAFYFSKVFKRLMGMATASRGRR